MPNDYTQRLIAALESIQSLNAENLNHNKRLAQIILSRQRRFLWFCVPRHEKLDGFEIKAFIEDLIAIFFSLRFVTFHAVKRSNILDFQFKGFKYFMTALLFLEVHTVAPESEKKSSFNRLLAHFELFLSCIKNYFEQGNSLHHDIDAVFSSFCVNVAHLVLPTSRFDINRKKKILSSAVSILSHSISSATLDQLKQPNATIGGFDKRKAHATRYEQFSEQQVAEIDIKNDGISPLMVQQSGSAKSILQAYQQHLVATAWRAWRGSNSLYIAKEVATNKAILDINVGERSLLEIIQDLENAQLGKSRNWLFPCFKGGVTGAVVLKKLHGLIASQSSNNRTPQTRTSRNLAKKLTKT